MTTTIVLQQAINGVVLGSLYVLVALGLTLIYGVLVQINFAHADFVTLGAFAAYFFMHLVGGGYILSIAVAFAVGAGLGWLINAAIFTPLRRKGNELLPLIATIGVSVMMQNLMLAWFGPIPYAFETQYSSEVIRFAGIFVSWQNVIIIIVSIADDRAALRLHEVHVSRQGAARSGAGPRDRGPDGHQPQLSHHADIRHCLGAGRHGRRHARAGAGADAICRHFRHREGLRDRHHRWVRQRRRDHPRRASSSA